MRWLVTPLISKNEPVPQGSLGPSPFLSAFLLLLTPGAQQKSIFCVAPQPGGPCPPPLDARGAKVPLPTQRTRDRGQKDPRNLSIAKRVLLAMRLPGG